MNEPEELRDRLTKAAELGDFAALEQALADGANAKARNSWALSVAARHGHVECARLLMAVSNPKANDSGALSVAAVCGHASCVAALLPVSENLTEAAAEARAHGFVDVAGMIEAFMEAEALSEAIQNAKMNPKAKSSL